MVMVHKSFQTPMQAEDNLQPLLNIRPVILVVDDDAGICEQLERVLSLQGYEVITRFSAEDAAEQLDTGRIDLMVTDLKLPKMSGIALLKQASETQSDLPVIAMSAYGDVTTAVEVLKLGATDFLTKPFDGTALRDAVETALNKTRLPREIRRWRLSVANGCEYAGIISRTPAMRRVLEIIRMLADTDVTAAIEGETGTGKELVATAIHSQSSRANGPFVAINCGGLPDTLLESELFGYERGAFTGAVQSRVGKIELADHGTLFLDEIESMSLAMQAKLLRVLETLKIQRLGGTRWIRIDCRLIVASNVPLKDLVARGQLRSDIYYRINVVPISLLPLRLRRDDIPLLVYEFIKQNPIAIRRGIGTVTDRVMNRLIQYSWPGNVRELQNVLERAIVLSKGPMITKVELQDGFDPPEAEAQPVSTSLAFRDWLKLQEKQYFVQQVRSCGGKLRLAARTSGIDMKTLYRKMRVHGINKKEFKIRAHLQKTH
jgi:DNA-binding NtrC family response regulator